MASSPLSLSLYVCKRKDEFESLKSLLLFPLLTSVVGRVFPLSPTFSVWQGEEIESGRTFFFLSPPSQGNYSMAGLSSTAE